MNDIQVGGLVLAIASGGYLFAAMLRSGITILREILAERKRVE